MNAYELADALQKDGLNNDNHGLFSKRIQNMLRQQADKINNMEQWEKRYLDRIAELEKEKDRLEKLVHQRFDDGKRLGILDTELKYKFAPQTKPLSDEEIDDVAKNNFEGVGRLIYMIAGNVKCDDFKQAVRSLARAIEERHGIK